MPTTVHGFGTSICDARGHLSWKYSSSGDTTDFDAVECFCIAHLPVVPLKTVHIFRKSATGQSFNYLQVPIRWSVGLVVAAFLRRWAVVPVLCNTGFFLFLTLELYEGLREWNRETLRLLAISASFGIISCLIWPLLNWLDRRNRALRTVLGPSLYGSSDPATWTRELLEKVAPPHQMFATSSYDEAVDQLLHERQFGRAMLAARLSTALEETNLGEKLTDKILRDPDVVRKLQLVQHDSSLWASEFGQGMVNSNETLDQIN
ncbi:hypothetical protein KOR42_31920 [Thalassoglobus neptunius]|uniref:Uncharacterized protein n=1 Tax=Thalassoglobus neptunius TaxID=1938619 RepID=A0A5C5WPB2_9PLAN|nr:hypothetical protein [Thalassoglobus neptunius]TWT52095.1 hypothetical protein KOR42_31920 [Thalassoglobus neptunius]